MHAGVLGSIWYSWVKVGRTVKKIKQIPRTGAYLGLWFVYSDGFGSIALGSCACAYLLQYMSAAVRVPMRSSCAIHSCLGMRELVVMGLDRGSSILCYSEKYTR